jgi:colanic acid/amylovoran biosynthesis glycosyltransferase
MRSLHVFTNFLPKTKNWLYHMLSNLPDSEITIAAQEYCKTNFYLPDAKRYIEFPLREIDLAKPGLVPAYFNRVVRFVRGHAFSPLIASQCGEVDLVHAHFANAGWYFLPLARRLRVPYIISFYGYDYEQLPASHPRWARRLQILFSAADRFLCEGSHGAHILERRGCPPEKIRVVPLGVRVDQIPFTTRSKLSGELKLVQVATIAEKKGHIFTVRAFLSALRACPNMTLDLVGDYHDASGEQIMLEMRKLISQHGAESRVRFLPGIAFDRLHSFLSDYHVFVHPSVYAGNQDCEGGAPIVLLDAQATGMPVLSTTHCDIPGEVLHGISGVLCPERDVEALAKSMQFFCDMGQAMFDSFCVGARHHVEERFNVIQNASGLRALYTDVCGRVH